MARIPDAELPGRPLAIQDLPVCPPPPAAGSSAERAEQTALLERAARRVGQILAPDAAAVSGLAAVRELYGKTQVDLAELLDKGQPAISGIEKGRDSKLETIDTFIRALGGRMEVRAVFPDGSIPVSVVPGGGGKRAKAKPARAARA